MNKTAETFGITATSRFSSMRRPRAEFVTPRHLDDDSNATRPSAPATSDPRLQRLLASGADATTTPIEAPAEVRQRGSEEPSPRRGLRLSPHELQNFRRYSDGPAWRWNWAQSLIRQSAGHFAPLADRLVAQTCQYVRCCVRGTHHKERARRRFPDIAAAEALVRDATKCEQLKILVVGDCPVSEIAARTGISVSILEAWESIFFDVRAARDASDWVFRWVMVPLLQQGNGRLAAKLKFAYAGGPLAAKALLDAEARVPLKQGVRLFDQKLLLQVKFEEALQYPLNSNRDALNFIKMHADLMYQEKRLQLQERKLAQRSDEALAKQKLAERRLEVSAQRLAERAARRAHGEAERSRQGAAAGL